MKEGDKMPHITINVWPGKTEQQKMALAARIAEAVSEEFGNDMGYISVGCREYLPKDWPAFYRDEIYGQDQELLIAPTAYAEPRFYVKADRTEYAAPDGSVLAVVLYPDVAPGVVEFTHTEVDASLQGQGIAGKLLERAAARVKADGKRAKLTCSYAVSWFERHAEYSDIIIK